jgi:hypothetical protein
MKIRIYKIEGQTSKAGTKQNKTYTLQNNHGFQMDEKHHTMSDMTNWWTATDSKGREYIIWDLNRDWSKIGIRRADSWRTTYTTEFEIEK